MSVRPSSDSSRLAREETVLPPPHEGAIRLPDRQRFVVMPEEFIQSLPGALAAQVGAKAGHLLYQSGYEWGLQEMLRLSHRLRTEFGDQEDFDLWQMDAKFVLDRWWSSFAAAGWGTWSLDRSLQAQGVLLIQLHRGETTPSPEPAGEPRCHLQAGLFAGAVSFFERTELHAVEIPATATDPMACQFIIGPGPVIDQAEAARARGATPDAILRAALAAAAAAAPKPTKRAISSTPQPAPAATTPAKIPWKK